MTMGPLTAGELIARYDLFFLDAYGVLVRSSGVIPEAAGFLRRIEAAGKRFLILSNDASRSPETTERRYRGFGLPISVDQVVTSGMLLRQHYAAHGLAGAPTIVLGTEDSDRYVVEAGGKVVAHDDDTAQVLVVADDDGYDLLDAANKVVTVLLRRLDRGQRTQLVLPNPDLVFPGPDGSCGLTAGAIAAMIEAALRLRDPAGQLRFVPLGKPHRPIFEAAMQRCPGVDPRRIVMVGDQIVTDIRGAADFGLDSAFVETGVGRRQDAALHGVSPTWVLPSLA
jgi:HAD superfamily hydrolase (TIGR01459 family)